MKTLREFARFVGMADPPISSRALQRFVFFFEDANKTLSLRDLVRSFDYLDRPWDFDLVVEPTSGTVPFGIVMNAFRPAGRLLSGQYRILRGGQELAVYPAPQGNQAEHGFHEAGNYVVEATFRGIGSNGIASVTKSVTVTAQVQGHPPDPISTKPVISVKSKGDGSFEVTGSGFLPNTTVHIRIVDDALTQVFFDQGSTPDGQLNFPTGKICQVPGARLHFSANDGRPDKNDITGTLWSNTVTTTCPAG